MNRVVLSYPFSGSAYAFIDHCLCPGYGGAHRLGHPYYRTLYGPPDAEVTDLSLSIFVLFDEIIMVAADTALPDHQSYETNGVYRHPDLGLTVSWQHYRRTMEKSRDLIGLYLSDKDIHRILQNVPENARQQILSDVRQELDLANDFGAPVLCSPGREALLRRMSELDIGHVQSSSLVVPSAKDTRDYVRLVGPIFKPLGLDELVKIKGTSSVRTYAHHFASTMFGKSGDGTERPLLELLEDSIDRARDLEKSYQYFDVGSRVLDIAGLFLGPIPALLGKGVDYAGEKRAQELERTRWFEFGPAIQRAQTLAQLSEKIQEQKDGGT